MMARVTPKQKPLFLSIETVIEEDNDTVHLLFAGEVAIVHDYGVIGLAEGAFVAMGVAVVAIVDIAQDLLEDR